MTPRFVGSLTPPEEALSTSGLEFATESVAASERMAPQLRSLYDCPPATTFGQYRQALEVFQHRDHSNSTDTTLGEVPIRRFTPSAEAPIVGTYVHLHGGGWCLGSHRGEGARLQALSDATCLAVISVGYRLAPEYPFPACVEDCIAVAQRVARLPGFRAIGGDSAGAQLAVLTLCAVRDLSLPAFDAAVLAFGAFDLASASLDTVVSMLLPEHNRSDRRHPSLSPLFANLQGMPPARFVVGTRDDLLDDTLSMNTRWQRYAPTELDVFAGAPHGFTTLPISAARLAGVQAAEFLNRVQRDLNLSAAR